MVQGQEPHGMTAPETDLIALVARLQVERELLRRKSLFFVSEGYNSKCLDVLNRCVVIMGEVGALLASPVEEPTDADDILTVARAIASGLMTVTPRASVQQLARAYVALRAKSGVEAPTPHALKAENARLRSILAVERNRHRQKNHFGLADDRCDVCLRLDIAAKSGVEEPTAQAIEAFADKMRLNRCAHCGSTENVDTHTACADCRAAIATKPTPLEPEYGAPDAPLAEREPERAFDEVYGVLTTNSQLPTSGVEAPTPPKVIRNGAGSPAKPCGCGETAWCDRHRPPIFGGQSGLPSPIPAPLQEDTHEY